MANCPSCNADAPAGTFWCASCRTNVVNPAIGRLASPGKRLGAFFLDLFLPLIAIFLIFVVAGGVGSAGGTAGAVGLGLFLGVLLFAAYVIWNLVLFAKGTTPGKKLLSMRVVKEDGLKPGFFRMLIREWIGKFISGLMFLLGFLWILFDRNNQGWHDKLVNTYVVQ